MSVGPQATLRGYPSGLPFGERREDAGQAVQASWVEASLLAGHLYQRGVVDLVSLETDHDARGVVGAGVDDGGAQAGGEDEEAGLYPSDPYPAFVDLSISE